MKQAAVRSFIALCSIVMAAAVVASISAPGHSTEGVEGDANCDGKMTVHDALPVLRSEAEIPPAPLCIDLADVDCNDLIDSSDALAIITSAARLGRPPGCVPTSSPTATTFPTESPFVGVLVEVGLLVEGDDPDGTFTNNEVVSPGSEVTWLVTIDNDSSSDVTITSLVDNLLGAATCLTAGSQDVLGAALAQDDGDGQGVIDGGADQVQCIYTTTAPTLSGVDESHSVTTIVEDGDGLTDADTDSGAITTTGASTATPTPTATPSGVTATLTDTPTTTASPLTGTYVELGLLADGNDANTTYTNDEFVTPSSDVTYLVTIDNDSGVAVTVDVLTDDISGVVECIFVGSGSVTGRILAPDDGDGAGVINGGVDQIRCTYHQAAPSSSGVDQTRTATVTVGAGGGRSDTGSDSASIYTVLAQPSGAP